MAVRRNPPAERTVFHFLGKADGAPAEITLSQPVQRTMREWTAHLEMTGPFREDLDVHGATKKQAIELALGLCHLRVGERRLVDRAGATVRVPGKPLPEPRDVDDGVRADEGLCVCLVDEGNGKVRLVLDDVGRTKEGWVPRSFYTHKRYPKKKVAELTLSPKELAAIGRAVLARLVASSVGAPRRRTNGR